MRFWQILLWISVAFLLFAGVLPILKMFFLSMLTWMHEGVSWDLITHSSLLRTLLFATIVAFVSTAFGMFLGIIFAKTDIPFRAFWMTLLSLPLLLPSDIVALGWVDLLLPFETWSSCFESPLGALWIEVTLFMPVAMLLCYLFLRRIPSDIEMAALLYVDEKKMLRTIDLPLLRPALALSFLIIAPLSLGEYAVPNALHIKLYTVDLFTRFSAFYDFDATLIMSLPLLGVALTAISLEHTAMRKTHFLTMPRRSYKVPLPLSARSLLLLFLGSMLFICTLLPLWGLASSVDSAANFFQAFLQIRSALLHSLVYALLGGATMVAVGSAAAVAQHYHPSRLAHYSEETMLLFFIMPSIIIAVASILFYNTAYTAWVYTTPLMLLLAYLAKYLILPAKVVRIALLQLPKSLSEAALIHGATPVRLLRHILLPLLRNHLVIAFLIGALFCLRESTLTMLLLPPGDATLPLYLATHAANTQSGVIASMALWMVIVVLLLSGSLVLLAQRFSRRDYGTI